MAFQQDIESINASLQTVGAQLREHRGELNARIQHLEQAVAMNETGGGWRDAVPAKSVSAQVLAEARDELEDLRNGKRKSVRASVPSLHVNAATITSAGTHPVADRDAEIYGPMRRPTSVRDLLVQRPTLAGSIEYLRGARAGTAAIQQNEGDQKAELALSFTVETAPVRTIACWVPASRQVLDDMGMLSDYIDSELRDALRLAEDAQLLSGTGTNNSILGMMTLATAYSRAVTGDKPNDTLRRAVTQVQLARGIATGIVVNPEGLEKLELSKDNEGRYLVAITVTDSNGRASVWRVPTVVTDAMPPNQFMVGDFTRAARLYDRRQATVEISTQHADFFTRNLVAILGEQRVALTVNRPDLLVIGTFA